jgi:hypothetical protein
MKALIKNIDLVYVLTGFSIALLLSVLLVNLQHIQSMQEITQPPQGDPFNYVPANEPNCADVLLRNPGGLSHIVAWICVDRFGVIESNTAHLTPEKYRQLIQPVKDSLWTVAIHHNLIDEHLHWEKQLPPNKGGQRGVSSQNQTSTPNNHKP